ncbi:hypothetical protein KIPB_014284, partial [Kipferlia bialata]|eukprot:g14284.t1
MYSEQEQPDLQYAIRTLGKADIDACKALSGPEKHFKEQWGVHTLEQL